MVKDTELKMSNKLPKLFHKFLDSKITAWFIGFTFAMFTFEGAIGYVQGAGNLLVLILGLIYTFLVTVITYVAVYKMYLDILEYYKKEIESEKDEEGVKEYQEPDSMMEVRLQPYLDQKKPPVEFVVKDD